MNSFDTPKKPQKIINILNYKDSDWVIIPDRSSINEIISEINYSRRLDPTFGLFEDIYDNYLLKSIRNTSMLVNKIYIRYSTYQVIIKRYKLKIELELA